MSEEDPGLDHGARSPRAFHAEPPLMDFVAWTRARQPPAEWPAAP